MEKETTRIVMVLILLLALVSIIIMTLVHLRVSSGFFAGDNIAVMISDAIMSGLGLKGG